MPALHICPLHAVERVVARTSASHLLTVINRETIPRTPPGIAPERHLKLGLHDITAPMAGLIHPNADHIGEIIDFARAWDRRAPMVVHCWAGISRSTAAAFITLCTLNPDASEAAIASELRARSHTAMPNALMIALADAALGRGGRMVEAIEGIGDGAPAMEGKPFAIAAFVR